jgi:hypothetical protein
VVAEHSCANVRHELPLSCYQGCGQLGQAIRELHGVQVGLQLLLVGGVEQVERELTIVDTPVRRHRPHSTIGSDQIVSTHVRVVPIRSPGPPKRIAWHGCRDDAVAKSEGPQMGRESTFCGGLIYTHQSIIAHGARSKIDLRSTCPNTLIDRVARTSRH